MTRVWTAGCFFTGWSFKGGSSDTLKWFKTLLLSLTCLDEANRLNLKKGWSCWRRSITGGGWCFGKFLQEFKSFLPLMPGLHLEHCPVVSWQNKGFLFNWHQRDLKQTLRWDLTSARVWKWNLDGDGTCQKASCFSDWWVFWFQMYTIFTDFFTSLLPCSFWVCHLLQMGLLLLSCTLCTPTQQVSCSTHLSSLAPQDFKLNKLSCSGERCHSPLLKALTRPKNTVASREGNEVTFLSASQLHLFKQDLIQIKNNKIAFFNPSGYF